MYQLRLTGRRFGDPSVEGEPYQIAGATWRGCRCRCGNLRGVSGRWLLAGELTCCVPCEVRQKMEGAAAPPAHH